MNGLERRFAGFMSFALLSGLIGFAGMFGVKVVHVDPLSMIPLYVLFGLSALSKIGMLLNQKRAPLSLLAIGFWGILFFIANSSVQGGYPPPVQISGPSFYTPMAIMTVVWWLFVDVVEFFTDMPRHLFSNAKDNGGI